MHALGRLRGHPALLPALVGVGLMLVWTAHNGGYDADTWYWGALVTLSLLATVVVTLGVRRLRPPRPVLLALGAFALYVGWSYLSIAWAQSPGTALEGSNRALLYLMLFAVFAILPWTLRAALVVLTAYVLGVGAIGLLTLARLATGHGISQLISQGRLLSPTGYFNSTAALFTIDALMAIGLSTRRAFPMLLRAALVAIAAADVQLAILAQSRGWLFTLPLVILLALVILRDRLRIAVVGAVAAAAGLAPLHRLLAVYRDGAAVVPHSAAIAGRTCLLLCLGIFVAAALAARAETLIQRPRLARVQSRRVGTLLAVVAVAATAGGFIAATGGHPSRFIQRQWHAFVRAAPPTKSSSNFGVVGSGRYDFWRVAVDALAAHPLGGLGQDNFADYYVTHRHTAEEPQWVHSVEMRLLAHTGLVGFALFAVFMAAAVVAGLRARRSGTALQRRLAGVALVPLIVWVIHGSVDWFWEVPALTGPTLGFLAMAGGIGRPATASAHDPGSWDTVARAWFTAAPRARRVLVHSAAIIALLVAGTVLGFPYLSVRETSVAGGLASRNPAAALQALSQAARLNPLSAVPDRLAGTIALQTGSYALAEQRFSRSITREPGGWFAWLGAGLAASELGDRARARHDFEVANSINSRQPVVPAALRRIDGPHPLTPAQALRLLLVAH
jgi:O-antigen ligase